MAANIELILGDCRDVLRGMADNSVDSIVTDPPAGIAFMGKDWDKDKGGRDNWVAWMTGIATECLRVLKPGGHALVWALPRTSHWTATAWENAGFEVRDRIAHIFGSGFPKSLDVSKAIDKAAGAERPDAIKGGHMGISTYGGDGRNSDAQAWHGQAMHGQIDKGAYTRGTPATPNAEKWQGWGTALKPAMEDWWLLRKPLIGTVAQNVLEYGTGGINIDGCRVETEDCLNGGTFGGVFGNGKPTIDKPIGTGRWPANLIHDGSDEVVGLFPETKGGTWNRTRGARHFNNNGEPTDYETQGTDSSTGSAARFFYCSKASKRDRDEGLEGMEVRSAPHGNYEGRDMGNPKNHLGGLQGGVGRNFHPCVKPTALMRYLCRLVTPPGGVILDPFAGSGSTGKAAVLEGFGFIGIEKEAEYLAIAERRIEHAREQTLQPALL